MFRCVGARPPPLGPGGPGPLEREHRAQRAWRRAAGAKNFEMQSANKRFPSVFCVQAPMTHKPHQSTAVYH